jgi:hypothetical protein
MIVILSQTFLANEIFLNIDSKFNFKAMSEKSNKQRFPTYKHFHKEFQVKRISNFG